MEYAAIAIAILGMAVGATFRLRFVLGMILAVLVIALVFVLSHPRGILNDILVVVVAQALLQGGYFAGLVGRVVFSRMQRKVGALPEPKAEGARQNHES